MRTRWHGAVALPCLWLQLDACDVDPASFVHFLRVAAKRLAPRRRLRVLIPSAVDLRDVPGFIRCCFRGLALTLDRPWVLVLDNVQDLGRAPLLYAAIAGQQLALIEASALRFSDDETRQLVHLHERNWPAAALRQATDGWAAAMILWLAARRDLGSDDTMLANTARDRLFAIFAGEDDLPDVLAARAYPGQIHPPDARTRCQARRHRATRSGSAHLSTHRRAAAARRGNLSPADHLLLALEQRSEAYEVYRRCRQQLSVLLGIAPAPETEALVASLRNLQERVRTPQEAAKPRSFHPLKR